ncbi:MAG: glycosyltransferase [Myxococcales bacterium]|nr:glycosyltransferase [Myxococcales bacterium]
MSHLKGRHLIEQSLDRFDSVVSRKELRRALRVADAIRERMAGRVLWNVNSTAVGGGVAEMLQSLLRYTRGVGVDARWIVIQGSPEFFRITKRLHHALHGSAGDGSDLGEKERRIYEETLHRDGAELAACVRPGDVVLLHDPQTVGLGPALLRAGTSLIWRCHIGADHVNEEVELAWDFLAPYLQEIPAFVFSREAYVPSYCDHGKSTVIRPSIDAFSAKNRDLDDDTIRTVLVHTGLVEGPPPSPAHHEFEREDGSPGRVEHRADVIRLGRPPTWETPLVVQVSRWDPLKDFLGVMHGFASIVDGEAPAKAQLVLAGPNVTGVTDDPEGEAVFDEVHRAWRALPDSIRDKIHLALLPTADVEENATIVNALQRHAAVVVQKSLHEGFGLTVTEAMWKARPVLATAVGGIQDQIEDGVSGVLLKDPRDREEYATALRRLLEDPVRALRLGEAARERVREHFLGVRHLLQYARLIERLDEAAAR